MTQLYEKYLVERLKSGDKDAFRQLFEHYYPLFLSFAKRILRDGYVAEDLVQNVFMRMWILRERLDKERNLKNYLLVSVRNEIYYYFRSLSNKRHEQLREDTDINSFDVYNSLSAKELEQKISKVVASMPKRRREVFELSRTQKLSNSEIADKLDISVRTVEKHIENALADIRRVIPISISIIIGILF